MAIYHLSVKTVSRSKGQSATASAAYRAAEKIKDERTGEIFDYSRKLGVVETEIILPECCASMSREELWNMAEAAETRINSTVAREYEVAIPAELGADQRRQLVKNFAGWLVTEYGVAADIAIHEPNKKGDQRNHHAHILTSTRRLRPEGFSEKSRELDDRKTGEVEKIRERWEMTCNQVLYQNGENEISRRTLEAQGVERPPQIHVGAAAMSMVRSGRGSDRYDLNQDIKSLPDLKAELNALSLAENMPAKAPRIAEKAPSLKNAGELSVAEARALLRATADEIAKKPLAEHDKRTAAEQKILKNKEHDSFFAFVAERDRPTPTKGMFEFASTYERRLKEQRELKLELSRAHSECQKKLENHREQTQAERNKILGAAAAAAEQKHPEAVEAIRLDNLRRKAEQERKNEERKLQREAQKLRRGGRGIER